MKQRTVIQISMLLMSATVGMTQALADVAPPSDYVEQCTLEKQQVGGKSCVSCTANYSDVTKCEKAYAGDGYSKACKSWGASVWTEVWCKAGAVNPSGGGPNQGAGGATAIDPDPPEEPGWSCRMSGPWGKSAAGATLGIAMLAWLGVRRRRHSA